MYDTETFQRFNSSFLYINEPFTLQVGRHKQRIDKPVKLELVHTYLETTLADSPLFTSPARFHTLKLFIDDRLTLETYPTGKKMASAHIRKAKDGSISIHLVKKYTREH